MRRLVFFGLCALWMGTAGAQGQTAAKSPDVFLITIDTLRADHVGCYGYKQVDTPALDALAADGIRFTHAFTHNPLTNTSHTTILTGLLPSVHGVTDFGIPLSPQHATWAELLKKRGYHTGAFIGAVILDSKTLAPGLDRGFDFYDNFPEKSETRERFGRVERRAMDVVQHAETWLDKHRTGSRFVWVHMYDPHDPYEAPAAFAQKYKEPYDAEIAYTDSALAHFVAYLKKSGAYTSALIIVVSDHGEGLGEHGEDTHGLFLYDSTLHVPLIAKLPGAAQRGTVVDTQVRTTDILPTVLALTKTAPPAELNGESLMPLIQGKKESAHVLFGETDYPLRFGWAPLRALRTDTAKLIEAPHPELYDLTSDGAELKNIFTPDSDHVKNMRAELATWLTKLPPNAPNNSGQNLPDPKDKVQVQNLLHNAMLASDDNRPKDAGGFLEKALALDPKSPTALRQLGEIELASGDFAKAAGHLKQAHELRPEDSTAAYELGQALEKAGNFADARDALEASLKLVPSQITARLLLGKVYLSLNDAKNAEDQFEAAQLVDSSSVDARLGLAEAQIEQSKFSEALPDLEALAQETPANPAALRLLARAYRGLGKQTEAQQAETRAAAAEKNK